MKRDYLTPETELLDLRLEVNFTTSTNLGGSLEDGNPFDDFNPQPWSFDPLDMLNLPKI